MSAAHGVKKNQEFLNDISTPEIEEMLKKELPGKPRERLQFALLRREGKSKSVISKTLGRSKSSISKWLNRMQEKEIGARYDGKSTGRRSKLSSAQQDRIKESISQEPEACGFERSNYTAKLLATHIDNLFGTKYIAPDALALAHNMGFSVRVPRPVPDNTPDAPGTTKVGRGWGSSAKTRTRQHA